MLSSVVSNALIEINAYHYTNAYTHKYTHLQMQFYYFTAVSANVFVITAVYFL